MDETRLTTLESTITFHEKALQELSNEIHRQQREIDRLKAQLQRVTLRLDGEGRTSENVAEPHDERPPHY